MVLVELCVIGTVVYVLVVCRERVYLDQCSNLNDNYMKEQIRSLKQDNTICKYYNL